jgi:Flp pilus assembly protein TadG
MSATNRKSKSISRNRGQKGTALLEFAFVVPVLLVIVMGIIVFGTALNNYLQLTEATAAGARFLAVSRGQTVNPCSDTIPVITASATNLKASSMQFKFVLNGNTYGPGGTALTCGGAQANLAQSQPASVIVTYPCNLTVMGFNFAPGCTLTAQTAERVQ